MRFLILFLSVSMLGLASANEFENDLQWAEYKTQHDKVYKNSNEELERYMSFKD